MYHIVIQISLDQRGGLADLYQFFYLVFFLQLNIASWPYNKSEGENDSAQVGTSHVWYNIVAFISTLSVSSVPSLVGLTQQFHTPLTQCFLKKI